MVPPIVVVPALLSVSAPRLLVEPMFAFKLISAVFAEMVKTRGVANASESMVWLNVTAPVLESVVSPINVVTLLLVKPLLPVAMVLLMLMPLVAVSVRPVIGVLLPTAALIAMDPFVKRAKFLAVLSELLICMVPVWLPLPIVMLLALSVDNNASLMPKWPAELDAALPISIAVLFVFGVR